MLRWWVETDDLERLVRHLEMRVMILEERVKREQAHAVASAWPPAYLGAVPADPQPSPPPFHDPVLD